jgi:hypothetical protein
MFGFDLTLLAAAPIAIFGAAALMVSLRHMAQDNDDSIDWDVDGEVY